ncbi:MAG: biotin synthase BioB [Bdellovibrionales bacterium]|nr:biotin synthase BioB [Bdellovibrionales bacterium]
MTITSQGGTAGNNRSGSQAQNEEELKELLRHDWTREEIQKLYDMPFLDLVFQAASVHRLFHNPSEVQICSLLSIKTGGCPEDCGYCSQSVHNETGLQVQPLLEVEEVVTAATRAKEAGATRFCMGAAWREVRDNRAFDRVLEMVKTVNGMGLEVCCTLGMLNEAQAQKLKEAGLHAYNHNIDTSPENYGKVCSTRTIDDRLNTLEAARSAGLTVCCGGILGLGESDSDRVGMLHTLATLDTHPESVPINSLVKIEGTPFAGNPDVSVWDFIRTIAVARITMPKAMVRLAAGRLSLNPEAQSLAFLAGANSIFAGEKLLTTPNPEFNEDLEFLKHLGLRGKAPDTNEHVC